MRVYTLRSRVIISARETEKDMLRLNRQAPSKTSRRLHLHLGRLIRIHRSWKTHKGLRSYKNLRRRQGYLAQRDRLIIKLLPRCRMSLRNHLRYPMSLRDRLRYLMSLHDQVLY